MTERPLFTEQHNREKEEIHVFTQSIHENTEKMIQLSLSLEPERT